MAKPDLKRAAKLDNRAVALASHHIDVGTMDVVLHTRSGAFRRFRDRIDNCVRRQAGTRPGRRIIRVRAADRVVRAGLNYDDGLTIEAGIRK